MENIEKNQAINILVPKLIKKTQHLQKEIRTRLLLNKIFSEFENKASHKLNYFVTNSFKRYNCTKLGNNIDNFLSETERENTKELNEILNNDFYKDEDLKLEKKKMQYKSTNKLLKDINEIFDKIKYPLETRFSRNSKKKIKQIINENDLIKKKLENKTRKVEIKKIIPVNRNIVRFYKKQSLTNDKKIIYSELQNDQKSIQNSIDDYLSKVNNKIIKSELSKLSPVEILNSETFSSKPKINFPKIKFLNYNKIKGPIEPKTIQKKILKSPDIQKVLPYYKLFKKKEIQKKINKEEKKIPFITEVGIKVNKTNKEYDYNDTQNIVYNSANKELNIHKNMDDKRKKFEDLFGLNKVPKVQIYNDIIKQKIENSKMEKFKKMKNTKSVVINVREKFNDIINNEIKKLDKLEERLLSKSLKGKKKY